jgi:hypothetical protein
MTAPTLPVPLSVECNMAKGEDMAELHTYCRSAKDVPLPNAQPHEPPLIRASCRCDCHQNAAS